MADQRHPSGALPRMLAQDAVPIGPGLAERQERLQCAKAVAEHGDAIAATGRRYDDNPAVISTEFPQPDRAQRWYRRPGACDRVLP